MSINVSGTLLVPSEMAGAGIAEIQQAVDDSGLPDKPAIVRDVDRKVWALFEPERKPVLSIGLKLPQIMITYTCDTGGEPFFWEPGFDAACELIQRLGYQPVDPRIHFKN